MSRWAEVNWFKSWVSHPVWKCHRRIPHSLTGGWNHLYHPLSLSAPGTETGTVQTTFVHQQLGIFAPPKPMNPKIFTSPTTLACANAVQVGQQLFSWRKCSLQGYPEMGGKPQNVDLSSKYFSVSLNHDSWQNIPVVLRTQMKRWRHKWRDGSVLHRF